MNIRIVDGRLTRDSEVKTNSKTGTKYLSFTLANNSFSNGKEEATFFNVVSYNDFDIERASKLLKGNFVYVIGRSNESITVKEGNVYLNRNIIAHNIEKGVSVVNKEASSQSYHSVAPIISTPSAPTCEVPDIKPQSVSVQMPQIEEPVYQHQTVFEHTVPNVQNSVLGNTNTIIADSYNDELPF
jgi:single-stranded DNA-binding protein